MDPYNQLLLVLEQNSSSEESANTALSQCDKKELKNFAAKNENKILHLSCFKGWYDVSIRLIEEFGFDPNVQDHIGYTALYDACLSGNVELVAKLILSYKCNHLLPNKHGDTPLHYAIRVKNSVMVESLINSCTCGSCASCDPNTKDENGDTILHTCAFYGDLLTFKYLVTNRNCKPDIKNNKGETPLHMICSSLVRQGYNDDRCKILFYLLMDMKISPHIKFSDRDISILSVVCKTITNGNHDPSILRYLIIDCGCIPSNDSDVILYTLCNVIGQYGLKYIDILSQLVITMNIGPYITLEDGSKVCIMCCPVEYSPDPLQDTATICDTCHSMHQMKPYTRRTEFLECMRNQLIVSYYQNISVSDYMYNLAKFLYHIFVNVKCECHPKMLDLVKDAYLFDELVFNKATTDNSTEIVLLQNTSENIGRVCFRNPLHLALHIIRSKSYSKICSLFFDSIINSKLVNELMSKVDIFGNTLLHLACLFYHGDSTLIEYLLSTGKTDPLCVNNYKQTPLKLLEISCRATNNELNIQELVAKFGELKVSYPIESYVSIIIFGDVGVGKSTLAKVINDRHDIPFHKFKLVTGVELRTAGIVPHVLNDRDMGRIIVHDLAGQVEYYSSHTAVLDNLLQASAAVFVIVVSLADERSTESLQFWLNIVENASLKSVKQCHVFVVQSHKDGIKGKPIRDAKSNTLLNIVKQFKSSDIIKYNKTIFRLDCRKLSGKNLGSLMSSLSGACESIRTDSVREMSLYCHMLYGFLRSHGKDVYSLNELVQAIEGNNDYFLPTETDQLFSIIQLLSSTGLIMCLGEIDNPVDKVWIIADKSVLLKNL